MLIRLSVWQEPWYLYLITIGDIRPRHDVLTSLGGARTQRDVDPSLVLIGHRATHYSAPVSPPLR